MVPDLPPHLELAKAHRAACPIYGSCVADALERYEPQGVWGGEVSPAAQSPPGSGHAPPAQHAKEATMHPLILQQLAAGRVNDMIARTDRQRQARQARRARPSRRSRQRTRHSLPRTQTESPRTAAITAVAASQAPGRPGLPAGGDQGRELVQAERGHTRAR